MDADELLPLYREAIRPSDSVGEAVLMGWSKFANFLHGLDISKIEPKHLEDFQRQLLWEPYQESKFYSPNSVDQFLRRVRQVLRWAHQQGLVAKDPTACLLLPRPIQPVPELLSWAELQRLSTVCDLKTATGLRDALLLALLIETDLGLTAILALPVAARPPLEDLSLSLLDAYLETARPRWAKDASKTLLLTVQGTSMTWAAAKARVQQLSKAAGLGAVLPRNLRRSYLAHLAQQSQRRHSSFS